MALHIVAFVAAYHVTVTNAMTMMAATNNHHGGLAQPGCHLQ